MTKRSDRPTARSRRLYHQLTQHLFGEPEDLWVFNPADMSNPDPRLRLLHVAVWPADERCDVTSFNTLGMSDRKMKGADARTELHMGIRGPLSKDRRGEVARFLANLAHYPIEHNLLVDWWHTLKNPGRIPHFPGCAHVLLHPKFTPQGIDQVDDPRGPVKLLYVVPITQRERHLLVDHGRECFLDDLEQRGVDLLTDRTDPA